MAIKKRVVERKVDYEPIYFQPFDLSTDCFMSITLGYADEFMKGHPLQISDKLPFAECLLIGVLMLAFAKYTVRHIPHNAPENSNHWALPEGSSGLPGIPSKRVLGPDIVGKDLSSPRV